MIDTLIVHMLGQGPTYIPRWNMMKKNREHPEVSEIKNICSITPHDKKTKKVCEKIRPGAANRSHHQEK